MPIDPAPVSALELHRQILAELDKDDATNDDREKYAHHVIEDCAQRRKLNAAKRQTLLGAKRIYEEYLGSPIPTDPLPLDLPTVPFQGIPTSPPIQALPTSSTTMPSWYEDRPKPRARIGPQRYRILHVLREHRETSLPETAIASRTNLPIKRIHDQLRSDIHDGFVQPTLGDRYGITEAGLDLMMRFETYKRQKGQPLPPLQGAIGESDEDGDNPVDQFEQEDVAA